MTQIAAIGERRLCDAECFDRRIWPLFYGPRAFLLHGGNPHLVTPDQAAAPGQKLFDLFFGPELTGSVLVDEINASHRRAAIHVAVLPEFSRRGIATTGLLMTGALFGDILGFEYFYTYAPPGSSGSALAESMGFKVQGLLTGFSLTPEGRGDMLFMAGLWSELRQLHKADLDRIEWGDDG